MIVMRIAMTPSLKAWTRSFSTTRPGRLAHVLEDALDLRDGVLGADFVEDAGQLALFVDDECRAHDAHELAPVERLFAPDSEGLRDGVVGVGEEREAEAVFVVELLLFLDRIGADPEHDRIQLLQLREGVAQAARLLGATG